jgi:hypothetical protein
VQHPIRPPPSTATRLSIPAFPICTQFRALVAYFNISIYRYFLF